MDNNNKPEDTQLFSGKSRDLLYGTLALNIYRCFILFFLVLVFFVVPTAAQKADSEDPVRELMDVTGFDELLSSTKEQTQHMVKVQIEQMLQQIRNSMPYITDKFMAAVQIEVEQFVQSITNSWSPEEAERIYWSVLAENIPADQIRSTLEHYRTPEGQRDLKAIHQATSQMSAYISYSVQHASEAATRDFVTSLIALRKEAEREMAKQKALRNEEKPDSGN